MKFSIEDIKTFIVRNYQYFIVGVLFLALVIALIFAAAMRGGEPGEAGEATSSDSTGESAAVGYEVPDVPFEVNAYPAVNEIVNAYFTACAEGDMDTLLSLTQSMDETEQIRAEMKSKVTDSYNNIVCYTKNGPEEGSYFVFTSYDVKFSKIDTLVPGLTALFVKADETGKLTINTGDFSDEELKYFKAVSAQQDVVDLLNEIDAKYREAADADKVLGHFLEALPTAIDAQVSAELANRKIDSNENAEGEGEQNTENTQAKIKETVNVRSEPSKESTALGKLAGGDTVTVYENRDDGWSKVDYQGTEAYVKTEFLQFEGQEDTAESQGDSANQGGSDSDVIGKVVIKERVNIRKSASKDGEKLGSADAGAEYDLIMDLADGWCKIKYNGQTAYVKSEFVNIKKK